ncbi:matrix protein [Wuhan redfin culter dimarhabdovirus]|uniref:Matrix protein n=1 Tax=Wuhan redfin culter dimarhabdovirus TaxID=3071315 RepID=A0AAD0MNR7_9RHAB|nr:matrix protein [Wuhan redfin culter dimarhabodovirus]AVM87287.1 matrix protein [Wuhan redfin culter dimarhabodovirus]
MSLQRFFRPKGESKAPSPSAPELNFGLPSSHHADSWQEEKVVVEVELSLVSEEPLSSARDIFHCLIQLLDYYNGPLHSEGLNLAVLAAVLPMITGGNLETQSEFFLKTETPLRVRVPHGSPKLGETWNCAVSFNTSWMGAGAHIRFKTKYRPTRLEGLDLKAVYRQLPARFEKPAYPTLLKMLKVKFHEDSDGVIVLGSDR